MERFSIVNIIILLCMWLSSELATPVSADNSKKSCPSNYFHCLSGDCVPVKWTCDGEPDCADGSDEAQCGQHTCNAMFENPCESGKCIIKAYFCDGEPDCPGGDDEVGCNHTCSNDEYKCGNVFCIPQAFVCDSKEDCPNGEDEDGCERQPHCAPNEFQCKSGQCIAAEWQCDQENDCDDHSDELNCDDLTCKENEFLCGDKKTCIQRNFVCDGDNDCVDQSDEQNCSDTTYMCKSNYFMCKDASHECIHNQWVCDGDGDCADESDEVNCTHTCKPGEFMCAVDKRCIRSLFECDGKKDCIDGSDEISCSVPKTCASNEFDCHKDGAICISDTQVCDGNNDCGDFADEHENLKQCKATDSCIGHVCSHDCINHHKRMSCVCHDGFRLMSDKISCEDIDECIEEPGACSQKCINTKGSYKCSCQDGYILENHRFCRAVERPWLLFTNRKDIRRISLDTTRFDAVLPNATSAVALDFHYKQKKLYWSDVAVEQIQSGVINDDGSLSDIVTLIADDIKTPDGLAVDWLHDLLYWTDTGKDTIEVMSLSAPYHRSVLIDKNLDEPRAISVDPRGGWMYWTDWGFEPKIERAGMNGEQRTSIITSPVHWPNGLTVDYVTERLYWIDAKLHIIGTSKLNGDDVRILLADAMVIQHPFAITVFEDSLFWTDWKDNAIHSVNKFTGSNSSRFNLELHSPMDIHIYHEQRQPVGTPRCDGNVCSHLCLPAPHIHETSPRYSCSCPLDMKLTSDRKTCIFEDEDSLVANNVTSYDWNNTLNSLPAHNNSTSEPDMVYNGTSEVISHVEESPHMPAVVHHAAVITEQPPVITEHPAVSTQHPAVTTDTDPGYDVVSDQTDSSNKSATLNFKNTPNDHDTGHIAGLVIGICAGIAGFCIIVGILIYKYHIKRNTKSMHFDNPVYRKTTEEEQFAIDKNISTLQPLTSEIV